MLHARPRAVLRRALLRAVLGAVGGAPPSAALALTPAALAAQATDIVRGRVTGPDGRPLAGALVAVTAAGSDVARTVRSDGRGRYTVIFPNGPGAYLVRVTTIGMAPEERVVRQVGDEDVLVADVAMVAASVTLAAVRVVEGGRPRPAIGAVDSVVGGVEGSPTGTLLPLDQLGSLSAMAATVPGISLVAAEDGGAAGFSVLGLSPDHNTVTLDGLLFTAADVPRGAGVVTRVVTSTSDPSRGGFSGAQLTLTTFGGSNTVQRSASLTVDDPDLQFADSVAVRLGQEYRNVLLNGSVSGPLLVDRMYYNVAAQAGRRTSLVQSLFNADAASLQRAGVARDSVDRFVALLRGEGLPLDARVIPPERLTNSGSLLGRLDYVPTGTQALSLTVSGRVSDAGASYLGATAVPAHGGRQHGWGATVQALYSTYFRGAFLNETRSALTTAADESTPYVLLPDGRVRVSSVFDDGTRGVSTLLFGGNSSLPRDGANRSWEISNQTSWLTADSRHRWRFGVDARLEDYRQAEAANTLGSYSYNSIADLEAGLPSSFSRRLGARLRRGSAVNASLSLGDQWKRTPQLQLQYGVRLEANRFGVAPRLNPAVDSLFGLRTSEVPEEVHLSPRFGFTWTYGKRASDGSRRTLRGGLGEFRNTMAATVIAPAADATGLPDAAQQLLCVGPAAPAADWRAYMAGTHNLPTTCAGGAAGAPFADVAPRVTVFETGYEAARSWRTNLAWNGVVRFGLRASVEGIYSLNLAQPGSVDRNFARVRRFALDDEGGRPVFVSPTSIVPGTGAVALRSSRLEPAFAQVSSLRSDLRSHSAQLTAGVSPVSTPGTYGWSATYTHLRVLEQTRGFGGTTSADPYDREWTWGGSARHQLLLNGSYTFRGAVTLALSGRVVSGTSFTPMVSGDVNGDGLANDRAFVFEPAAARDSALARGMATLLRGARGPVRDCLREHLGRIADRNVCRAPWSASMNAQLRLVSHKLGLPRRAGITLGLVNPLTGIDQLLHGDDVRGWGQPNYADPTLLYVRGFDAAANRFRYEVNPRFGDASPARTVTTAPFRVTLDVRVSLSPAPDRQTLAQQLSQGRERAGKRLTAAEFRSRYARSVYNPLAGILQHRDSLRLTRAQLDTLTARNALYVARADSLWAPLLDHLAALGDAYDVDRALALLRSARNAAYDLLAVEGPRAGALLTRAQRRRLPRSFAQYFDARSVRELRDAAGAAAVGPF